MDFLAGYRVYIGAAGLAGLALYQASQGDYQQAYETFMGALIGFGLKRAIVNK